MSTHLSTAPHQSRKKRELTRAVETLKTRYGGEGGIRTLDTLLTYTPLAGARLQPLGHFSVIVLIGSK
jgi:hypothetical protein